MTPGDTKREVGRVAREALKQGSPHPHSKAWPAQSVVEKQITRRLGLRLRGAWPWVWEYSAAPHFCALPPALPTEGAPAVLRTSPGSPAPKRVGRGLDSRARPEPRPLPREHPFSVPSLTQGRVCLGTSATVTARPPAGGPTAPRQPCASPRGQTRQRRPFPAPRAFRHLAGGTGQRPSSPQAGAAPRRG